MSFPKVSIIIPVYNGANYLKNAIESSLLQEYPHIEIIVVNDGSTDNGLTESIANSFSNKISYYTIKHKGVSSALNVGIKKMTGDWFSWLSHDDIYLPTKISSQIRFINNRLDVKFIYANDIQINEQGNINQSHLPSSNWDVSQGNTQLFELLHGNQISGCTTLVHKSVFNQVGYFNEHNLTSQDWEMWLKVANKYNLFHQNEIVLKRRVHQEMGTVKFANRKRIDNLETVRNVDRIINLNRVFPNLSSRFQAEVLYGDFIATKWYIFDLADSHYQKARQYQKSKSLNLYFKRLFTARWYHYPATIRYYINCYLAKHKH